MDSQEQSWTARIPASLQQQYQSTRTRLRKVQQHNQNVFRRHPLAEISGSLGDLGTLLPLLIALTAQRSISLPSTLVFSGLANILTGMAFGIPLPVQPMKAIAAVAIARNLTLEETMSAGLFVAAAIGLLSLTGLVRWFTSVVPIPIVKGIQVGTGLSLIISAGTIYDIRVPENNWIVFLAFLALLATSTVFKRVPYALIILIVGILVVFVLHPSVAHEAHSPRISPTSSEEPSTFGFWRPHTYVPSPEAFITGVVDAGIGQLPLTTLNSVIAVSFLASDLFPQSLPSNPSTPSTTSLGLSVMAINLVGCFFGAMPICHGSGGLAAQYRFGARSGASIIFLGLIKLVLGLFAAGVADIFFVEFPRSLLCVLLLAAGLELVKVGESINSPTCPDLRAHLIAADSSYDDTNDVHYDSGDPFAASHIYQYQGQSRHLQADQDQDQEACEEDTPTPGLALPQAAPPPVPAPPAPVFLVDLTDEERKKRYMTMFMTVAGILAFKNDAIGFLAGLLCHWSLQWEDRWDERRYRGRIRLEGSRGRERQREESGLAAIDEEATGAEREARL